MSLVTDNQFAASCNFYFCGLIGQKTEDCDLQWEDEMSGRTFGMCDNWILDGQMHVSCGSQGSLANLKSWDEPGGRRKWEKIDSYST
jgi:hypothetical protein